MIIKEIYTNRLYLRPFKANDGPDLHHYLSHPYTKEMLQFNGCSLEQCDLIALKRSKGDSFFAVTLTNKLIGHVEFHETKHQGIYEIGYVFNPNYFGLGYAYEAIEAIIKYAKTIRISSIIASTSPLNQPSIRLLERLGFELYEGINLSDYADPDDLQYKIIT